MNKIFTYFILLFVGISPLLAQTASLLPPAVSQFFDNNGNPLSGGSVTTYIAGTTSNKTTWQDSAETIPNSNPIILDAGGKAKIWGQGTYREVVKDALGNLIWDAVTVPGGGSGGTTFIGDGLAVGSVLPWSGITAPNQYLFAAGQSILRTTYSNLLTIITQTSNVVCTNTSTTLTGMSDTSQIPIGSPVETSCVTAGTTVISKTSTSVTLSNPSNISVNTTAVFFPYGNGDGSTTFNLPDLRGYVIAGNNNMTGSASSRLTSTFFGTNPNATGAGGGTQSDSITIVQANLPSVTLATAIASGQGSHTHTTGQTASATNGNQGSGGGNVAGVGATVTGASTLPAMTGTTPLGGSGTSITFSTVQPTLTLNYVIKVLADVSTASPFASINVGSTFITGGSSGNCLYDNAGVLGEQNCLANLPVATTSVLGVVKCDGTTITCTAGVISSIGSGVPSIIVGTTTVGASTNGHVLYNNSGVLGDLPTNGTGNVVLTTSPSLVTPTLGVATVTSVNGSTFPGSPGLLATLNVAGQTITGGATVTTLSLSSASHTIDCSARPLQSMLAPSSAYTITAPGNDGSCIVTIGNAASSAVIPTFSGFSVGSNTGDPWTTVNSAIFSVFIWRVNGVSGYRVAAAQ